MNKVKNAAKSAYNKASTAVKNVFNRGTSSSGSSYRGSSGGGSYGASPTGYNPGNSGGSSYFSHGSGKIPSPNAPRIKDADEETIKYCKSGPRKATGNNYLLRSLNAFAFGDFSGEKQTLLSLGLGIGAGLLNVDAILDVRDFVYDVTHIGQLDNPALALALDVVALVPILGAVKYLRHVDDVADIAKGISKAGDATDVLKQSGNIADATRDVGKADDVVDVVDHAENVVDIKRNVSNAERVADTSTDVVNNGAKGSITVPDSLLVGDANTRVYFGIKGEQKDYVGITNNIKRRQSQHGDRFDNLVEITTEPLTRRQARAIEQVLILKNPQFSNKINSISTKRDWYDDALEWGEKWVSTHVNIGKG